MLKEQDNYVQSLGSQEGFQLWGSENLSLIHTAFEQ